MAEKWFECDDCCGFGGEYDPEGIWEDCYTCDGFCGWFGEDA